MKKFQSIDPAEYNYAYPKNLIAQTPARPRDSARLLVYDSKSEDIAFDAFKNISNYLPPHAVLVFNQTKVVPARFFAYKPTGGRVELLYTGKSQVTFDALANRTLNVGDTLMVSSGSSPREERLGEVLVKNGNDNDREYIPNTTKTPTNSPSRGGGPDAVSAHNLYITVTKKLAKGFRFKPGFPVSNLFSILDAYGVTPIPPYIKNTPLSEPYLRKQYQTVFAKSAGSSAAPTASLHFTKRLLSRLKKAGMATEYATLHVGLGTFAPLTQQNLKTSRLHEEWYEISAATAKRLQRYKEQGRPIVAVGTTVARTLESASSKHGKITKLRGMTDLFIHPPYSFKFVDGLITNFHVPKSSLMMLVASLVGREKLLGIYAAAVKKKFRLFSFGDGMLIK